MKSPLKHFLCSNRFLNSSHFNNCPSGLQFLMIVKNVDVYNENQRECLQALEPTEMFRMGSMVLLVSSAMKAAKHPVREKTEQY